MLGQTLIVLLTTGSKELASTQDATLGIAVGWSGHDGGGDAIFLHRVRRVQALTGENPHYTHDSLGIR